MKNLRYIWNQIKNTTATPNQARTLRIRSQEVPIYWNTKKTLDNKPNINQIKKKTWLRFNIRNQTIIIQITKDTIVSTPII